MRIPYFFGQVFFFKYKQMVIGSGSDNNNVFLRHSPRHFPEGNLVYRYTLHMLQLQRPTAVLYLVAAVCSGYTSSDYCWMFLLLLYDRLCVQIFTDSVVRVHFRPNDAVCCWSCSSLLCCAAGRRQHYSSAVRFSQSAVSSSSVPNCCFCSAKPHAPRSANVCDVLYHPGSQHYSTLRYSNCKGNKTNVKWTLALTPLAFSPREPRLGGAPCMYIRTVNFASVFGRISLC